ncbi:hypothetical protein FH972_019325 [Carpinus fangiana]|uniref:Uncharacterized protein n=1 Tax=Carpinus fangiana TaxID=176857 RepID=A0A5N6RT24_9ROSI|nr:hypothetical protein FH972_019325 [Carpinus fangiana]
MDDILRSAALQGDIDTLYDCIKNDPLVLDRFDNISFVPTPLHIAAFAGQIQFAMEIMRLKPSFARKLDENGFTPMHIAMQRNQVLLVNQLLSVDKDLVRVQRREGMTPLHYAAEKGDLYFLDKFFKVCPESLEDVTNRGENVIHIALKNDMVQAFKDMLRMVQGAWFKDASLMEKKLLYWQDVEDNTLLHVAVSKNQTEVVSLLLDRGLVDLDALNLQHETVFDIAERQAQAQIKNLLRRRGRKCLMARPIQMIEKWYVGIRRRQEMMTDERLNALLVVSALLLTVTFQALSPPGANQCNCTTPNDRRHPGAPIIREKRVRSYKLDRVSYSSENDILIRQVPMGKGE